MNEKEPIRFHDEFFCYEQLPLLCSGEFHPFTLATTTDPPEGGYVALDKVTLEHYNISFLLRDDAWIDLENQLYVMLLNRMG